VKLRMGTRASALARAQSGLVADAVRRLGHEVDVVAITTTGDRLSLQSRPLEGKGVFTKELDEALLDGRIDFAVHSLKDLPSESVEGLVIAAIPAREDARDALLTGDGRGLDALSAGARVGTGSPRREGQIRRLRPDLVCEEARGNVDTRIRRLHEGRFEAIILAQAGLRRLGRESEAAETLSLETMIPAVGQGALAIVSRAADVGKLGALDDPSARAAVLAERRLLRDLEGGCRAPIAAHARAEGGRLRITAAVFSRDGAKYLREEAEGLPDRPEELGAAAARRLLARGAAEIVAAEREAS
jgi:hydroxymethylbilane synthase